VRARTNRLKKFIYPIRCSQLSITFAVFDMFVCISFMCLRVHVDLIQPLAARNNTRCLFVCKLSRVSSWLRIKIASRVQWRSQKFFFIFDSGRVSL